MTNSYTYIQIVCIKLQVVCIFYEVLSWALGKQNKQKHPGARWSLRLFLLGKDLVNNSFKKTALHLKRGCAEEIIS